MEKKKREMGRYFTVGNPFQTKPFRNWARALAIANGRALEPFAGCGNIPMLLDQAGYNLSFSKYDIQPAQKGIMKRDTMKSFPRGYRTVITNPPWLAKNSAQRRGICFPQTHFDDLYKVALEKCLLNAENVCAIIPDTFITSGEFRKRLMAYVSLPGEMFADTEQPVGMALFGKCGKAATYWIWNRRIGTIAEIESAMPQRARRKLRFNAKDGNLGLIAVDGTIGPSIRFCGAEEIPKSAVKGTSRSRTRILVTGTVPSTKRLNSRLAELREKTGDMPLSSFKGTRKDGMYRRRISWRQAEDIVSEVRGCGPARRGFRA